VQRGTTILMFFGIIEKARVEMGTKTDSDTSFKMRFLKPFYSVWIQSFQKVQM